MDGGEDQATRLVRMALQAIESLQRSGVGQLPRASAAVIPARTAPVALESVLVHPAPATAPPIVAPSPTPIPTTPMAKRAPAVTSGREAMLAEIRREVAACRRCEHLACARTQTVFGVGPLQPRLCFFGEAPGAEEDRTGEPFVGRAGQLLTDIIEKGMRLPRAEVFILNVLKCRPPDNRPPTDEEINNCREYFERQLDVLRPEFICCLGATATKALLGSTQPLGRMRGKWFEFRGARVIVTYHPSYLLRNSAAKKDTWEDIQILMGEMGLPIEKK